MKALGVLLIGAFILWSLVADVIGDDRGNYEYVEPLPINGPVGPDGLGEPLPGCNWC